MSIPDLVNAGFEASAGAFSALNVRALWRSRRVQGVHWLPTIVFTAWGGWNLFYYPHLDQWLSFCGGLCIFTANITWLSLVWKFRKDAA